MSARDIYLCGVGGQGIGLLSAVLAEACLAAGLPVIGADTHGLAQRGGVVSSHLRLGPHARSPLVPPQGADLVLALERLEALRALGEMLAPGGNLLYYDAVQQPIHVRLGQRAYPNPDAVLQAAALRGARVERVLLPELSDPRQQNVALLGRLAGTGWIEGLSPAGLEAALAAHVPARSLESNLAVFRRAQRAGATD